MTEPTSPENPGPEPAGKASAGPSAEVARQLRDKTWVRVKRGLAKIWSTGGGGFYGLGYLITFIVYEIRLLAREFAGADGIVDFVAEQLVERVFRIAIDSLGNSIKAFLWPIRVLSDYELWGVAALVIGWAVYTYFLHERIVDYLGFDPKAERQAKRAAEAAAKQAKLVKRSNRQGN